MITATFSNGHQDTYKGKREVSAAWMIVNKSTGKVIASGHSQDRAAARKTASATLSSKEYLFDFGSRLTSRGMPDHLIAKYARAAGYAGQNSMASIRSWILEYNAGINAKLASATITEIVDI